MTLVKECGREKKKRNTVVSSSFRLVDADEVDTGEIPLRLNQLQSVAEWCDGPTSREVLALC